MSVHKDQTMHTTATGPTDDFEALLAASSLGAPHVRAHGEFIPEEAHHRLREAAGEHALPADDGIRDAEDTELAYADAPNGPESWPHGQTIYLATGGGKTLTTLACALRMEHRHRDEHRWGPPAGTPHYPIRRVQTVRRALWFCVPRKDPASAEHVDIEAAKILLDDYLRGTQRTRRPPWATEPVGADFVGAVEEVLAVLGDHPGLVRSSLLNENDASWRSALCRANSDSRSWHLVVSNSYQADPPAISGLVRSDGDTSAQWLAQWVTAVGSFGTDACALRVSAAEAAVRRCLRAAERALRMSRTWSADTVVPTEEACTAADSKQPQPPAWLVSPARFTDLLHPASPPGDRGLTASPLAHLHPSGLASRWPWRQSVTPPATERAHSLAALALWRAVAADANAPDEWPSLPAAMKLSCAQLLVAAEQAVDLSPVHRQAIPTQQPSPPDLDSFTHQPGSSFLVPRTDTATPKSPEIGIAGRHTSPPAMPASMRLREEHAADGAEISVELWMRFHLSEEDEGERLPVRLTYRTTDPYAVTACFNAGTEDERVWTFAHDLLDGGLTHSVGIGDVVVWPSGQPDRLPHKGRRVFVRLRSPEGSALLSMAHAEAAAFIEATASLVTGPEAAEFTDRIRPWHNDLAELTCPGPVE
ncbi:SsgA family sporulation/cell division regulator [Streptomyces chrestomyceticus]|uniref:SsgA family sporulation/cell division regulator n=1 Tax=Streptomyces chrestomyceticus TaxID=68185 RepID=UPI00340A7EC2